MRYTPLIRRPDIGRSMGTTVRELTATRALSDELLAKAADSQDKTRPSGPQLRQPALQLRPLDRVVAELDRAAVGGRRARDVAGAAQQFGAGRVQRLVAREHALGRERCE